MNTTSDDYEEDYKSLCSYRFFIKNLTKEDKITWESAEDDAKHFIKHIGYKHTNKAYIPIIFLFFAKLKKSGEVPNKYDKILLHRWLILSVVLNLYSGDGDKINIDFIEKHKSLYVDTIIKYFKDSLTSQISDKSIESKNYLDTLYYTSRATRCVLMYLNCGTNSSLLFDIDHMNPVKEKKCKNPDNSIYNLQILEDRENREIKSNEHFYSWLRTLSKKDCTVNGVDNQTYLKNALIPIVGLQYNSMCFKCFLCIRKNMMIEQFDKTLIAIPEKMLM